MIEITDITDPMFVKLVDDAQRTTYLDRGLGMFSMLCLQYNIDETLIADPIPYVPKEIQVVCTMIGLCTDFIGSDFREIREGFSIDVYKAKLDSLNARLSQLLLNFTPIMCGYTVEGGETDVVSNSTFTYGRG